VQDVWYDGFTGAKTGHTKKSIFGSTLMDWSSEDHRFMARAIQLAKRASYHVHPNPKVGCVLVKDNKVIAEGWHHRAGDVHAEINTLLLAGDEARDSSCYVTLEPCSHTGKTPPCINALIEAGIKDVTVAMADPNPRVSGQGIRTLEQAGIRTRTGLLQAQAEMLNPGFLKRMRSGMPFVRCKMAMGLDGRTALANGVSKWITSETSRRDVHKLRARSSAILTGVDTILSDDPSMTVREIDTDGYQPLRVIMDSQLRISKNAAVLEQTGRTVIFTISDSRQKKIELEQAGAVIIKCNETNSRVDMHEALGYLAAELEINEVIVEAGPTLAGHMIEQGLIDELIIYAAPLLMGDSARGLFTLPCFKNMEECPGLFITDISRIGDDVRITAKISYHEEGKAR